MAVDTAGVFFAEGSPTTPPKRFGVTIQSSRRLGLMAQRAPMTEPSATISAAPM